MLQPVSPLAQPVGASALRIWDESPGFVSYYCARCGARGYAGHHDARPTDPEHVARARKAAEARQCEETIQRRDLALSLWRRRQPVIGTAAERYLRTVHGYHGAIPPTLGYLSPSGDYPASLIATFAIPSEPAPGLLAISESAVRGIHLTRIKSDGTGKAGTENDKIVIGRCPGVPIVLAPPNDISGLAICEGIEDGLSLMAAGAGLGVWVAGAAGRMPALADNVPAYFEAVTIIEDNDTAGRTNTATLADRLNARGIETFVARVQP